MSEALPGAEHRGSIRHVVREFAQLYSKALTIGEGVVRRSFSVEAPPDKDLHERFESPMERPEDLAHLRGFAGDVRYVFLDVQLSEGQERLAWGAAYLTGQKKLPGSLRIALGFTDERAVRPDFPDPEVIRRGVAALLVPVVAVQDGEEAVPEYRTLIAIFKQGDTDESWQFENGSTEDSAPDQGRSVREPTDWRGHIINAFNLKDILPLPMEGGAWKREAVIEVLNEALRVAQVDHESKGRVEGLIRPRDAGLTVPGFFSANQAQIIQFAETALSPAIPSQE